MLLFDKLQPAVQRKVVREMYERPVAAGEILIKVHSLPLECNRTTFGVKFLCEQSLQKTRRVSEEGCLKVLGTCMGVWLPANRFYLRTSCCWGFLRGFSGDLQEGDTGLGASELYVVKSGEFEVLERRHSINMRVNMKARGDVFGEISLMYDCPRSATVAATVDSLVWVLERDTFRYPRFSLLSP